MAARAQSTRLSPPILSDIRSGIIILSFLVATARRPGELERAFRVSEITLGSWYDFVQGALERQYKRGLTRFSGNADDCFSDSGTAQSRIHSGIW